MGLHVILYITAVLVSIVFERQERRHNFELQLEYDRLGKKMPPAKPRLSLGVSWLNVLVGLVMIAIGIPMLMNQFMILDDPRLLSRTPGMSIGAQFEYVAVWLATSVALILLGLKSVYQHRHPPQE